MQQFTVSVECFVIFFLFCDSHWYQSIQPPVVHCMSSKGIQFRFRIYLFGTLAFLLFLKWLVEYSNNIFNIYIQSANKAYVNGGANDIPFTFVYFMQSIKSLSQIQF